jgi:transcriptional regulator with XRE-family HTH domain
MGQDVPYKIVMKRPAAKKLRSEPEQSNPTDDAAILAPVARRMRAARLAYGAKIGVDNYTIVSFAKALGLKSERLSRYERGERSMPISILMKLHKLTGVSLNTLLAGTTPPEMTMMIMPQGLADGEYTVGDRLYMVRKLLEPSVDKVADLMEVPVDTWRSWERGAEIPPVSTMIEFCRQFGDLHRLGLDFLYRGKLTGIATEMRTELLRRYPRLAQTAGGGRAVMASGHRTRTQASNNGQ